MDLAKICRKNLYDTACHSISSLFFVVLSLYPVRTFTLRLRSVHPLASVWGKTTLNSGSVGGAGVGRSSNLKNGAIFSFVLGTSYTKMELQEELSNKIFLFYCSENWKFLFECSASRSSIFWKLL